MFVCYWKLEYQFNFRVFKGEELLRGVSGDMYKVTVGEETCTVTDVTDTIILCKPPTDKPKYHTVVKVKFVHKKYCL